MDKKQTQKSKLCCVKSSKKVRVARSLSPSFIRISSINQNWCQTINIILLLTFPSRRRRRRRRRMALVGAWWFWTTLCCSFPNGFSRQRFYTFDKSFLADFASLIFFSFVKNCVFRALIYRNEDRKETKILRAGRVFKAENDSRKNAWPLKIAFCLILRPLLLRQYLRHMKNLFKSY